MKGRPARARPSTLALSLRPLTVALLADQGYARAQFNLGVMHAKGEGVPKDDQQTYVWLLLASVGGDAAAIKCRDWVETRLTPQQRAAAQADARNWRPR